MKKTVLLYLVAAWVTAVGASPATDHPSPNILFIMADDLGFSDVGCYGSEIPTPNLDRLAAEGLRFHSFYNESKCSPSRATVLSGVRWQQAGTGYGDKQLTKNNFTTLPRVLGAVGYRTGNFGKWHVSKDGGAHGFDTWVERPNGEDHFLESVGVNGKNVPLDSMRYGPDLYTDYVLDFISESDKPFFAFVAYYTPHFPLQAPAELIKPHLDVYRMGWDEMRERRYRRQLDLGIISKHWKLSPREEAVPPWSSLSEERQKEEAQLMAVHAAMVQRMDWNIGRLLERLDEKKLAENTLVFFCSDNGACPWVFNKTPEIPAGPPESFRSFDSKWANACNTPFRYFKQWSHEGGICTPAIARWPAGIKQPGRITGYIAHLVDVMPTLAELSGAEYPQTENGHFVLPMEGESFAAAFSDPDAQRSKPLFWEFFGGRAMRDGRWKLVGERGKPMELYDMEADGTELNDLSAQFPERREQMKQAYDEWAARVGAKSNARAIKMGPSNQERIYP